MWEATISKGIATVLSPFSVPLEVKAKASVDSPL